MRTFVVKKANQDFKHLDILIFALRDLDAGKQQVRDTHFQSWGV